MAGLKILEGKYIATMDLYPQESREFNRIYPFYEHLRQGRFTTTRCKGCGHEAFPPRVICPNCLSEDLEWIEGRGLKDGITRLMLLWSGERVMNADRDMTGV